VPRASGRELYIGVTDFGWFDFLAGRSNLDEVNFWRPGGGALRASQGAPFLFKLKAPYNSIAGVGFFEYSDRMTIADAWEFYGEKNGAADLDALIKSIRRNRDASVDRHHVIGCLVLSEPTLFPREDWIQQPPEWNAGTQQGAYFDMDSGVGERIWLQIETLLGGSLPSLAVSSLQPFGGRGKPALYLPRQGQGTFRRLVLAAYENRCAITGERTLPVVEAAHIAEFSHHQRHEISNGIALRSDIHRLFDRGYVSIRPDNRFVVSRALAEDFNNGKVYYELHEALIRLPSDPSLQPRPEYLEEHYNARFRK
jgi:putative restriction endonuclease